MRGALTVGSGIARCETQPLHIDAQELPGGLPALGEGQIEQQALIRRHRSQEFSRISRSSWPASQAGESEGDICITRPLTAGHRGQHIARGGHLDEIGDFVRGVPLAAGRCNTKPRSVRIGPPHSTVWAPISSSRGSSFICESTSRSIMGEGLFKNQPQGALIAVLTHQCHRMREVTVGQRRHRDEQMVRIAGLSHVFSMAAPGEGLKEPRPRRPGQRGPP